MLGFFTSKTTILARCCQHFSPFLKMQPIWRFFNAINNKQRSRVDIHGHLMFLERKSRVHACRLQLQVCFIWLLIEKEQEKLKQKKLTIYDFTLSLYL